MSRVGSDAYQLDRLISMMLVLISMMFSPCLSAPPFSKIKRFRIHVLISTYTTLITSSLFHADQHTYLGKISRSKISVVCMLISTILC